jgi:DDE superfamily endonuclease
VFLGFGAAWGMPLLFLIAGMGIWYSLAIERWLLRHPRFQLHFTPTYSSWLNLVERWFAELTSKWL